MPTDQNPNTRYLHRWQGYYIEDCLCIYCLHSRGSKRGCSLDACICMDEKLDALTHGRIERKGGIMIWDK